MSSAPSPSAPLVLVEVADRVATVTLNRPGARNALSSALSARIREVMAEVDGRDDVDVIVLTGADPAFCAGLDLKELGSTGTNLSAGVGDTSRPIDPDRRTEVVPTKPWAPTSKPVIGAINGVAITGGFELALQCDFLVASEKAAFGDTHSRVGILPGWGLSVLLPQAIGLRRAIEMSLTGNFMSAHEARHFGLVNHVVSHEELLPFARHLALDIVGNNGPAVRELLASYRRIHRLTVGDGEVEEAVVSREWSRKTYSPDAVEARRAAIMERGRSQQS